jgi:hypothetical protein
MACARLTLALALAVLGVPALGAGDAPGEAVKGKPGSPPPDAPRPPAEAEVRAWIAELGSPDFVVREAATRKLLGAGDDAMPFLFELQTDDAEVRARVDMIMRAFDKKSAGRHEHAAEYLKTLEAAQARWRADDWDRNGAGDFWTRDVAGFHCVHDADGKPVRLIELDFARADAAPGRRYPELGEKPRPWEGYYYKALKTDQDGKPYLEPEAAPPKAGNAPAGPCTHRSRFAFCAFPARYIMSGRFTFVMGEDGVVWQKDLGPDAKGVDAWPHPERKDSGWQKYKIGAGDDKAKE